tara:strand:- start:279 stop:500 length:222 start_codon:yes stop_codon:yes gene_type:complete
VALDHTTIRELDEELTVTLDDSGLGGNTRRGADGSSRGEDWSVRHRSLQEFGCEFVAGSDEYGDSRKGREGEE